MVYVTEVVLGDVGRSPRMQYHAYSLAAIGYDVQIIGYGGSTPHKEISNNDKIKIQVLADCPEFQKYFPKFIAYLVKTLWQTLMLFFNLFYYVNRSSVFLLVQSPPAIPVLAVCWVYCLIFRIDFIIDWHNYGFANMALSLGDKHLLVKISHWYEGFFGRRASHNICVTKAMKDDLKTRWNIKATVLHDKPFHSFQPVTIEDKHSFFLRISKQFELFSGNSDDINSTIFTVCLPNNIVANKVERPAMLVSSTSWTEDEDFSILLSALQIYDLTSDCLPQLICAITGKGPLKNYYIKQIEDFKWKKVKIITPWLEPEDYPVMLAVADLGVCLHKSSSGLDLPMKVVDMFGCGLPVAAYDFKALPELVKAKENGFVFRSSSELAEQLKDWFYEFPNNVERNEKYKKNIIDTFLTVGWHENWLLCISHIFQHKVDVKDKRL